MFCDPAGKHGFLISGHGTVSSRTVCLLFHLLLPSLVTILCKVNLPAILVKVASFFCQMCEVKGFDATSGSVPVRLGQDIDCVPDPHRSLEPEQGGQAEQGAGHVNGTSGESSNEDTQSVTHR